METVELKSDDPSEKLAQNQQRQSPTVKERDGDPERKLETWFNLAEISLRESDPAFVLIDLFLECSQK